MKSLPFVKDRALASRNAQASVAAQWVWPEKNVAEWDSALTELETLGAVERTASVDLQGKTIIARPGWPFLEFLKNKYGLKVNVVAQNFSVAAFLGNKEALQQGYYIAEPHHIVKAGGKMPRFLSTWDAGFRAYAVLITNRKFAREHPDQLRTFTRAYLRGWQDYLEGDPRPAHAAMKQANATNTDEFMMFSRQMIIDEKLVTGRDRDGGAAQIGRLDPARFATQIAQLEQIGLLPKGKVTPASTMTTEFLPK